MRATVMQVPGSARLASLVRSARLRPVGARLFAVAVCLALCFSTQAFAGAPAAAGDVPRAALGAAPSALHLLPQAAEGQVFVPEPHPVRDTRTVLLLTGLGLTAAGLVLGGAGFAVLSLCQEGSSCYSKNTTIIGWALAAPGVLPLAAGLIILYIVVGGRGGRVAELLPHGDNWAVALAPAPGGAAATGVFRF